MMMLSKFCWKMLKRCHFSSMKCWSLQRQASQSLSLVAHTSFVRLLERLRARVRAETEDEQARDTPSVAMLRSWLRYYALVHGSLARLAFPFDLEADRLHIWSALLNAKIAEGDSLFLMDELERIFAVMIGEERREQQLHYSLLFAKVDRTFLRFLQTPLPPTSNESQLRFNEEVIAKCVDLCHRLRRLLGFNRSLGNSLSQADPLRLLEYCRYLTKQTMLSPLYFTDFLHQASANLSPRLEKLPSPLKDDATAVLSSLLREANLEPL
eukprot:TRINITY_DN8452_c0_g1_i1.p1 TRINITY_DN8452_c0_g1~~TRINITY_DN8452_c0_g1_i1.p1  ORF type:complete len:268 (-),score=51.82 TRINITY_DN8452_c0_g1_i1:107-910(-)